MHYIETALKLLQKQLASSCYFCKNNSNAIGVILIEQSGMLMESKDVDGVDHLTSLETAPPDQEISDILSNSGLSYCHLLC